MSSGLSAFLAYLLGIIGSLVVFLSRRTDRFAVYHAAQSTALFLFCAGLFVGWYVFNWLISWIPLLGPVVGVISFALVIAGWLYSLGAWIMGMKNALTGKMAPLPIVGRLGERMQGRGRASAVTPISESGLGKTTL